MTYETFIEKNFRSDSLAVIHKANEIIADYQAQGYTLTLRQLYYQFVSQDLIPNSDREYKKLGNIVTDGRLAGLISWDGIEDRGRSMTGWLIEEDIDNILADLPRNFAVDMWGNQERYIEVWVEKDALSSVVRRACQPLRVGYMACKGYLSASEAYRAGKRMEEARDRGQEPLVIHLGDHDPSGIDMTRDNTSRLELLSYGHVEVQRIALNRDQIDQYKPPPNPAKITDSRAADYIAEHGPTSWELDALEPGVLVDLITREIKHHIDWDYWNESLARERHSRDLLRGVRKHWNEIEELLESKR